MTPFEPILANAVVELISLAVKAIFVENMVLAFFLGTKPGSGARSAWRSICPSCGWSASSP